MPMVVNISTIAGSPPTLASPAIANWSASSTWSTQSAMFTPRLRVAAGAEASAPVASIPLTSPPRSSPRPCRSHVGRCFSALRRLWCNLPASRSLTSLVDHRAAGEVEDGSGRRAGPVRSQESRGVAHVGERRHTSQQGPLLEKLFDLIRRTRPFLRRSALPGLRYPFRAQAVHADAALSELGRKLFREIGRAHV